MASFQRHTQELLVAGVLLGVFAWNTSCKSGETSAASLPAVGAMGPLAAFPGAEGGGAMSEGGRGGDVYIVNTIDDGHGLGCGPSGSGTCTLRDCAEASGARTCVFSVAGKIDLDSTLYVSDPYLTIAGQTAPGSGIQLTMSHSCQDLLEIGTHDVLVQYLRLRKGWGGSYNECGGNLHISPLSSGTTGLDTIYNVAIDHCSIDWNQGQGIGSWTWGDGSYPVPNAITLSWNFEGEGIYPHSVAALTGSDHDQSLSSAMVDIDMHHSMMVSFSHRMPLFKHGRGRVINNIFYNPGYYYTSIAGGGSFDLIGNVYRPGPRGQKVHGIHLAHENATTAPGIPDVYVHNNFDAQYNLDPAASDAAQWTNMVRFTASENGGSSDESTDGTSIFGSAPVRRATRLSPPTRSGVDITPDALVTAEILEAILLPEVGASKRLDCQGNLVNARDSVDARLIAEYQNGGGKASEHPCFCNENGKCFYAGNQVWCRDGIDDPLSVLDWPAVESGSACTDTDGDGMPDAWEADHGLDAGDRSDGPTLRANGYSNLEHYLSGRVPNGTALPQ